VPRRQLPWLHRDEAGAHEYAGASNADEHATPHGDEHALVRWATADPVPHLDTYAQVLDKDADADSHRHTGGADGASAATAATTTTTTYRRATTCSCAARYRYRLRQRRLDY
jgi:hypothetical protein